MVSTTYPRGVLNAVHALHPSQPMLVAVGWIDQQAISVLLVVCLALN